MDVHAFSLFYAGAVYGRTVTGDPKEIISFATWVLYAVLFHNRLARGWYGRMTGAGVLMREAPRGAVLNARLLRTFSAAWRITGSPRYRAAALHAYREIRDRFDITKNWRE